MSVVAKPPGVTGDPFFTQSSAGNTRNYSEGHDSSPYLSSDVIGTFFQSSSVCLNADLLDKEIERMKAEFGPSRGTQFGSHDMPCPLPTPPLSVKSMSPVSSSPRSQHTVSTCSSSSLSDISEGELEEDSFVNQLAMDVSSASNQLSDEEEVVGPARKDKAGKRLAGGWSSSSDLSSSSDDSSSSSSDDSSDSSSSDSEASDAEDEPIPTSAKSSQAKKGRGSEKPSRKSSEASINSLAVVSSLSAAIPRLPVSAMVGVVKIIDPSASAQEMDEFVVDLSSLDERKLLQLHTYVMDQIHQQITQLAAEQTKTKTGSKTTKRTRSEDNHPPVGGKRPRSEAEKRAKMQPATENAPTGAGKRPRAPPESASPGAGKRPRTQTGGKKLLPGKRPRSAPSEPQRESPPASPPPAASTQKGRKSPTTLLTAVRPTPEAESVAKDKRNTIRAKSGSAKSSPAVSPESTAPKKKLLLNGPKAAEPVVKKSPQLPAPALVTKKGKKSANLKTTAKNARVTKAKDTVVTSVVTSVVSNAMWPTSLYTCDDDDDFVDVVGV